MKCPICESELTEIYRHAGSYGTEESRYDCMNCNQYYEVFAYGSTEINIGDFMTGYSHRMDRTDLKELHKKIQAVAELYKPNQSHK